MTTASQPPTSRTRVLKGKRFQNVEEVREKNDGGTEGYHFAKSCRTLLNNGKGGGVSVLIVKGSILRRIKFWKCSEKYTIKNSFSLFLGQSSQRPIPCVAEGDLHINPREIL
jgi:hypothetical protein